MKIGHSIKVGISFGLTSGVITTLGLIVGLHSSTLSKPAVIGGILIIAIADAFSDALGIHISEETENKHTTSQIWQATFSTFLSKFLFSSTFILPFLLFKLNLAVLISIGWGILLLTAFSFLIAKRQKAKAWKVIGEHLLVSGAVIILAHYLGDWIRTTFQ